MHSAVDAIDRYHHLGLPEGSAQVPLTAAYLEQMNQALATITHALELESHRETPRREHLDASFGEVQQVYSRLRNTLVAEDPSLDDELPAEALKLMPAHLGSIDAVLSTNPDASDDTVREVVHTLSLLPEYAALSARAAQSESILTPHSNSPLNQSLGKCSIDLMSRFDTYHEDVVGRNIEQTHTRNKQLATLQEQLTYMYEQRAQDGEIDRDAFCERYCQACDLFRDMCCDMPDMAEYVSFPDLSEEDSITDETVRNHCQKLELLKIRAQGSISDLSNDMQTTVQLYSIIIDIMKNMQEMDRNEREAIVRRTGS